MKVIALLLNERAGSSAVSTNRFYVNKNADERQINEEACHVDKKTQKIQVFERSKKPPKIQGLRLVDFLFIFDVLAEKLSTALGLDLMLIF